MLEIIGNKIGGMREEVLLGGVFVLTFLFKPLEKMMSNITYDIFSQGLTIMIQILVLVTIILKLKQQVKKNKRNGEMDR